MYSRDLTLCIITRTVASAATTVQGQNTATTDYSYLLDSCIRLRRTFINRLRWLTMIFTLFIYNRLTWQEDAADVVLFTLCWREFTWLTSPVIGFGIGNFSKNSQNWSTNWIHCNLIFQYSAFDQSDHNLWCSSELAIDTLKIGWFRYKLSSKQNTDWLVLRKNHYWPNDLLKMALV